jgi:tRNA threonylcarbamoyladenosine biosynthesis protein TsaB
VTLTLAIDTAGEVGSVAVTRGTGRVLTAEFRHRRHAAEIAPAIGRLLSALGATHADLSRIVLADGPGSFTGLRIGFATALGVAHAVPDAAAWVAPALMGAAWAAAELAGGESVAALFDALRGDVYGAVYRFDGGRVDVVLPPTCGTIPALAQLSANAPALAVGDGAVRYASEVQRWIGRAPVVAPAERTGARALLGLLEVQGGAALVDDLATYQPTYGRPAEAQARWERSRGRPLPRS